MKDKKGAIPLTDEELNQVSGGKVDTVYTYVCKVCGSILKIGKTPPSYTSTTLCLTCNEWQPFTIQSSSREGQQEGSASVN